MTGIAQRMGPGQPFTPSQLARRGFTVVRQAGPYGFADRFTTTSPCCGQSVRISAVDATAAVGARQLGTLVTCRQCGWKYEVYLACDGRRLNPLPREAGHPRIKANQAEWVSRGHGTRRYRRKHSRRGRP